MSALSWAGRASAGHVQDAARTGRGLVLRVLRGGEKRASEFCACGGGTVLESKRTSRSFSGDALKAKGGGVNIGRNLKSADSRAGLVLTDRQRRRPEKQWEAWMRERAQTTTAQNSSVARSVPDCSKYPRAKARLLPVAAWRAPSWLKRVVVGDEEREREAQRGLASGRRCDGRQALA